MNNIKLVIYTTGESEFKSAISKEAHKICTKELKEYVVAAAKEAGIDSTADDYILALDCSCPFITGSSLKNTINYHLNNGFGITAIVSADNTVAGYMFNNENYTEEFSGITADGEFVVPDKNELFYIKNRVDLACAEKMMQKVINEKHMLNGVTIHSPETVLISPDAQIGTDTEIYANVVIEGSTTIGKNVCITSNTKIVDSCIADGVSIQSSVILNSEVGEDTTVGPFAYIRPNCVVGSNARIGDSVELKNCNIGNGTKVSHLTYVGDADVGEKCNFGCGTVTVNYDGKKKYRTVIGNNVFVGCNSNLVAPVTLKDGAYTAAGSTITDEVPENNLAIARARQVNKTAWNDRRKG